MTERDMVCQASRGWNNREKPPLCQWLSESQDSDDCDRLKCLGNIVFPAMGRFGLHIIEHSLRASP